MPSGLPPTRRPASRVSAAAGSKQKAPTACSTTTFGRERGKHFAAALGFSRDNTPCRTTLHYLFVGLDKRVRRGVGTLDDRGRGGPRLVRRQPRRQDAAGLDRRAVARRAPVGGSPRHRRLAEAERQTARTVGKGRGR